MEKCARFESYYDDTYADFWSARSSSRDADDDPDSTGWRSAFIRMGRRSTRRPASSTCRRTPSSSTAAAWVFCSGLRARLEVCRRIVVGGEHQLDPQFRGRDFDGGGEPHDGGDGPDDLPV